MRDHKPLGDGGAAHEERLRSLAFPPGVRPWNDADIASLTTRFGFLQSRITELSTENVRLKREPTRRPKGLKLTPGPAGAPGRSVHGERGARWAGPCAGRCGRAASRAADASRRRSA